MTLYSIPGVLTRPHPAGGQELEEEALAAEMRWDAERAGAEARAAQQRIEEAQQRARLEVLQAESDCTKQQLAVLRQKMQNKPAG